MSQQHAQLTMRQNYLNGGPGVCVSGIVWLAAAVVTWVSGFTPGIIVFFIAGIPIPAVSSVIEKAIRKAPPESSPDKGLVRLSLLTLPILFGGLYLAYRLSSWDQTLFYPVMAGAIGLRYLIFSRVYGLRAFIGLGLALIIIGVAAHFLGLELVWVPVIVGAAELLFGTLLIRKPIPQTQQ